MSDKISALIKEIFDVLDIHDVPRGLSIYEDSLYELLAERDRQAKAEAWDKGFEYAAEGNVLPGNQPLYPNPYREEMK